MKKCVFLSLLFIFPIYCFSQEKSFHRPDPQGITDFLSGKLDLSIEQKEKIRKAVEKKAEEFDKLSAKYIKKSNEIAAIKKEMEPLELKMTEIYNSLPETVMAFLDDAQKAKFDELRKPKKKPESTTLNKNDLNDESKTSGKKKIKKIKRPADSTANSDTDKTKSSTADKVEEKKSKEPQEQELDIFYP